MLTMGCLGTPAAVCHRTPGRRANDRRLTHRELGGRSVVGMPRAAGRNIDERRLRRRAMIAVSFRPWWENRSAAFALSVWMILTALAMLALAVAAVDGWWAFAAVSAAAAVVAYISARFWWRGFAAQVDAH